MNLFPTAFAEETAAQVPEQGSMLSTVIIFAVVMFFFYFFMVRPQGQKRKEAEALLKQLGVGDEVQTNGGIVGRIVKVSDDGKYFVIAINETTNVTITRDYVVAPLPKGTLEAVQASAPKSSK